MRGSINMISVIIPCYNEEQSIGKTLDNIIDVMKKENIYINSEIIVVNDGSEDNSKKEALKRKVIVIDNPCNMGYGYSLKKGIEKKSEFLLLMWLLRKLWLRLLILNLSKNIMLSMDFLVKI